MKKLLGELNRQLSKHKIMIKTGVLVDASITVSDFTPDVPVTFEILEDRKEQEVDDTSREQEEKYYQKVKLKPHQGVDTEARWVKKGKRLYYGYKKHIATNEDGLILNVETTPANVNDTKKFKELIKELKLSKGTRVMADKGYASKENREFLKDKGLKSGIQYKATRSKALAKWELKFNKLISKKRYSIERTFGSIVKWFNGQKARYKGLLKAHYQHVMQAIAYNLYRAPGLVWKNA